MKDNVTDAPVSQTTTVPHRDHRWLAFGVLCLGALMIVLDVTIVNVALPSIREALGFSEASLAWVVNAYLLTFGGCLLLGGRLGDLYGHRRVFLIGLAGFTLASLACGLSDSQGLLVVARAVQGIGGAVVDAVALSLMMNLFTEPAERAKAMGVFGFVCAGGGSIGVLLGGLLTSALSWHWIFLVNVPVGALVFALTLRWLPAARGDTLRRHLDLGGAVTITAALLLAVYAVVNGNAAGWTSARTLGLLVAALVLFGVFLTIEARVRAPLMPLKLFRLRNLSAANVVGVLWAAAMFAWFFLSALYLQLVLGYNPMQVGLAFLPANIVMAVFSVGLSARLVMRFGYRLPLATGLGLAAAGLLLFARAPPGREFCHRRATRHAAARHRRGHRLQSGVDGGDERRGAGRIGPGVRDREHRIHDGRRAGSCRARESGGRTHRFTAACRPRPACGPERRISCGISGRRLFCCAGGRGGRGIAARQDFDHHARGGTS